MTVRFGYEGALTYSPSRSSFMAWLGARLRALAAMPLLPSLRRREPRASLHLNEHLLRDMGLERSHAGMPAVRPYWRG